MTKIKIDIKNGLVEVEGEEKFVKEVYSDYKDVLTLITSRAIKTHENQIPELPTNTEVNSSNNKKVKHLDKNHSHSKTKESYKIIGELNLSPENIEAFRDFFEKKKIKKAMEINAVAVYYLEKILGIKNITPNHIYSCYKNVNSKVPVALLQSLRDTASIKGWIDTSDTNNIHLLIAGENLVEHDLPKVVKQK